MKTFCDNLILHKMPKFGLKFAYVQLKWNKRTCCHTFKKTNDSFITELFESKFALFLFFLIKFYSNTNIVPNLAM
jgi:hypothetical protein